MTPRFCYDGTTAPSESGTTPTVLSARLSRVVSRTVSQGAWLSQILEVSKTVRGGFVPREFESLPLRYTEKTHDYAVSRHPL